MGKNQDTQKGKLSSIILSALSQGDKYGFEIISEIEKQTNGTVVIKQPSLYSSLKRMEDQDLISSYWMDSEIGGRRHYYRLTDYGKKQLEQWKTDFDIVSSFCNSQNNATQTKSNEPTFLQQENLFDMQENQKQEEPTPKPFEDDAVLLKNDSFIQYNLFEQPSGVTKPDFTSSQEQKPQNTNTSNSLIQKQETSKPQENNDEKSYDIFAELDLFRNSKKSFAGSQTNAKPKDDYHSNTLQSFMGESFVMQNLDNSFVSNQNMIEEPEQPQEQSIMEEEKTISFSPVQSDVDAKLITDRYDEHELPKVKRIDPPIIDVFASSKNNEIKHETKSNSYDEKIGELYNKNNKNASSDEIKPLTISNYANLKKYFDEQKISFNTYTKSDKNKTTQTSLVSDYKFALIRYGLTFLSLILSLAISFICIKKLSYITNAALALYIVPPVLYLIYAGFVIINKAKNKDRKVLLMETSKVQLIIKISIFIVIAILIYVFNLIGGLNSANFNDYTNTMIVPFVVALQIPLTSLYSFVTTKFKCIK
ncbi:MAG: PadR family transcriptional regulator [Christensenellales bacterium]